MWLEKIKEDKEISLKKHTVHIGQRTCMMGILNVTPDSFSDGGECADPAEAVKKAFQLIEEGADIIDIGGESSRPGADPVSLEEELNRVIPVIKALAGKIDIPVSVDTYKSEVAAEALSQGAEIINDITALNYDDKMAGVIADFDAGVILMHMKGDPSNMQKDPEYADVIGEIYLYLSDAVNRAESAGIDPGKIIIDPGIGFGKRIEDNLRIIKELEKFKDIGKPVLIGTSRKSFIGDITGKGVSERDFGTAASIAGSIMNGADIVRVHDIAHTKDVVTLTDGILNS